MATRTFPNPRTTPVAQPPKAELCPKWVHNCLSDFECSGALAQPISPLAGEMPGRAEGGAVPPTYPCLGSSPPPRAGERWPRSGRRGGLRRALPLSVSASPSHLSPTPWGRGIFVLLRRDPSHPPLACRPSPPQGGRWPAGQRGV
ncbi:hypothetical protein EOA38_10625 [Mesorhizobium sp. M1E.F.Ca.ET.041.01.1.1]|nr:hypothetical protein EOA38_10625 [Mesorhizobium sp. M1E.F.Ca.ET.041.01.1.1]